MSPARRTARLAELDPRPELLDGRVHDVRARIADWLSSSGEPGYRTRQILHAVYGRRVASWAEVTTLPALLRERLEAAFRFPSIALDEERTSTDGTVKVLWRLLDGEAVESVLIPSRTRDTLCGVGYICVEKMGAAGGGR